ncbi:MAG: lasso peptide biosynthesis B2 protein [Actinomycetota bacterium]|nr:lasso peptide biosynthesis B2 protein [Actinomycetota bacterium]
MTYTRVRWWLWRHEVREVVRRLRDGPVGMQPASPESAPGQAEYESALRLGRAASRTLRLLPTDGRCLMRSLVLTGLLARRGISSTLIIGVRPEPEFSAHAWVEHGGRPLLPSGGSDHYGRLAEM